MRNIRAVELVLHEKLFRMHLPNLARQCPLYDRFYVIENLLN